MSNDFNFDDLSVTEVPVSYGGIKYILREASEDVAAAYRNASIAGAKLEDGKLVEMPGNIAGVQALLVSRCLFPITGEGEVSTKPVPQKVVGGWPSRVVKPLFEKVKEISELDEEEDLEALFKQRDKLNERISELEEGAVKNGPNDTEGDSD